MFEKRKAAKLQAARNQQAIAELRTGAAQLPDPDGVISIEAFQEFVQSALDRGIDLGAAPDVWRDVRVGLAQGGHFIETGTTLLLKKDESPLLDIPAELLKEVADREFRGGSRGVSIPLGHGLRYRAGAMQGQMVTVGTHWTVADAGTLTVTDQRVVYHGGRKTLEFPFAKLATLNVYTDAIDLGVTSRQSTSTFSTGDPELVAAFIRAALNYRDGGVTVLRLGGDDAA